MMNSKNKSLVVALPIEVKSRELFSKSILAYHLARLGITVLIGRQAELSRLCFYYPELHYLDKSCAKTKINFFKKLRNSGYTISAFCEEGLGYRSSIQYVGERVSEESLNLIHTFWCWGEKQLDDIHSIIKSEKLVVTSHHRGAILNYHKTRYSHPLPIANKRKVLFLGTFGKVNPADKNNLSYSDILKKRGTLSSAWPESKYIEWDKINRKNFYSFLDLIEKSCSKYKDIDFLVKPHPSENPEPYINLTSKYPNLSIANTPSTLNEISAASLIVTGMSTTAIEATLLDKPCVVYTPYRARFTEIPVVQEWGLIIDDIQIALNYIEGINQSFLRKTVKDKSHIVCNIDTPFDEQFTEFAYAILQLVRTNLAPNLVNHLYRISYLAQGVLKHLYRTINPSPVQERVISKCPYINKVDVEECISSMNMYSTYCHTSVKIEERFKNVVTVSPLHY